MDSLVDSYLVPVVNGFAYGLLLFTVAAGLTLALGVADVLNLAHGGVYVAGGYAAVTLVNGSWSGLLLAILVAVAFGTVFGGGLSLAVAPLLKRGHLPQMLLTFGISLVLGALLVDVFGADDLRPRLPAELTGSVFLAGHRYPGYRLAFIAIAATLALIGWLVITRTRLGARVRAMVDDADMVACLGINPRMVLAGVMAVACGLAALAGTLGAPILGPGPAASHQVMIMSLVIVVVGGLGSIPGAFVAAIVVGQIQSLGVVVFKPWAPYLVPLVMGVALVLRRRRLPALAGAR